MKSKFLPFEILHEDDDFIVIDKPQGLLTTHTSLAGRAARLSQLTAENLLNGYVRKGQRRSSKRVWLVHRLDRETSGVMMFVKSEALAEAFRARWNELTEKTYLARVEGEMAQPSGVFESYLREDVDGYRVRSVVATTPHARFARTEWRRLGTERGTTLVTVSLKSGRKNQIRVHFAEAGHPVVGDEKYGARPASRMYLHSLRLAFTHPTSGRRFEFAAAAPPGFGDVKTAPIRGRARS